MCEGCGGGYDDDDDDDGVLLNCMYSWHWRSSWFGYRNMAFQKLLLPLLSGELRTYWCGAINPSSTNTMQIVNKNSFMPHIKQSFIIT